MMEGSDELIRRARDVRTHAYAPYSRFQVGAALMAWDGSVHLGCNMENASFGMTLCAERIALGAAVARGHRRFRAIALSTASGPPVPPCGACRQVLAEFAPDLTVFSEAGGVVSEWTLEKLLPEPFGAVPPTSAGEPVEGLVDR